MFSLHQRPGRLCDGLSRRELIRVGGLSLLGLSLPDLARARQTGDDGRGTSFGKAKNVIFLWLQGGPPQHETFDPKPDAPAEIRGEFNPIATNVPGIQICELLPRTAAIVDKLAIVRSLCTHSDLHDASGYWILTGYPYKGQQSRQITRSTDWPYLGSVLKMLAPSPTLPSYTSVWLPDVMRLNDNVQPAGQTAGFLGVGWDPQRVICDPSDPNFQIEGLALPPEIPALRLSSRQSLLEQVERHFETIERGPVVRDFDRQAQEAFGLLTSGRARQAFDLSREPEAMRERYGRHKWGQCVLLARRLVEAGARLVHVNWPREGGDEAVSNPLWDTHAQNADRLQDVLCPQFDVTFTALIEDLEQRGLLSETLVVTVGEFGRTPKINSHGGRDHWGHVFSLVLAGAGISGARVYGSSDKHGAYPRDGKLEPQDLTATMLHLLGVGHGVTFPDPTGRPQHATLGEPLYALLGDHPATPELKAPVGEQELKNGPAIQTKDAFVTYRVLDDQLKIDGGLMLPAGTHNFLQGGGSLYGWDFFLNTFRYGNAFGSTNNPYGRDAGVQLRGLVANNLLEYRLGIFQGRRNTSDSGAASSNGFRYAGRVQLNFLDPETGYFYGGTYLGTKKIFSVGASADVQQGSEEWYRAFGGDAFVDLPAGPGALTAQVDLLFRNGGSRVNIPSQTAFMAEAGYRFDAIKLSPIGRFERRWGDQAAGRETDFGGGLAFWPFGHTSNLKAFYTRLIPDSAAAYDQFNLQWQVNFY